MLYIQNFMRKNTYQLDCKTQLCIYFLINFFVFVYSNQFKYLLIFFAFFCSFIYKKKKLFVYEVFHCIWHCFWRLFMCNIVYKRNSKDCWPVCIYPVVACMVLKFRGPVSAMKDDKKIAHRGLWVRTIKDKVKYN